MEKVRRLSSEMWHHVAW